MAQMIQGIQVVLHKKTKSGLDEFNQPVYTDSTITVENVLVAPASSQEITDALNLNGSKAVYTLGIPKDDANVWEDCEVEFFGEKWHVIGIPTKGIESLIPLDWNLKVMVERYA